jgi:TetR/AcrR family transcriptional regulator of autoinduction and epiphytic fitness
MNEGVNTQPGRRERKALETQRRVLEAAETLFVRDGFAATTMTAIAEAADVAVQTIYAVFGTKRAILTRLLDIRTVGDDQAARLQDRDDWHAMERETNPLRQLTLLAAISARIGARIGALTEVMAAAAGSDPEIAALYELRQQARYEDQRHLARSLASKGALRAGLSEAHATDILWTLANARTYRTLVTERRWAIKEYEPWLADVLACSLLAEPAT